MFGKIEVIEIDIQARPIQAVIFLGILQQKGGFTHAPAALDAYQTAVFVDLIHQVAFDRRLDMLNEILVCPIKRFHGFSLKQGAKVIKAGRFGKPTLQFIPK